MAIWTTGTIKNPLVLGERQTNSLSIRYQNTGHSTAVVQIRGYYLQDNIRIEYVVDAITLEPGSVKDTQHYAQFDALEFRLITNTDDLKLKVWGKNATGNMTVIYPLFPAKPALSGYSQENDNNTSTNWLYKINSTDDSVVVIDKQTQVPISIIPVGHNPQEIAHNPYTGRLYVSNGGSNSVTVIDGITNAVIATVLVGYAPREISVDVKANRIYVTNQGSNTISVINGTTHTVMSTLMK